MVRFLVENQESYFPYVFLGDPKELVTQGPNKDFEAIIDAFEENENLTEYDFLKFLYEKTEFELKKLKKRN